MDAAGAYRFNLRAANGEVIASSEAHENQGWRPHGLRRWRMTRVRATGVTRSCYARPRSRSPDRSGATPWRALIASTSGEERATGVAGARAGSVPGLVVEAGDRGVGAHRFDAAQRICPIPSLVRVGYVLCAAGDCVFRPGSGGDRELHAATRTVCDPLSGFTEAGSGTGWGHDQIPARCTRPGRGVAAPVGAPAGPQHPGCLGAPGGHRRVGDPLPGDQPGAGRGERGAR